MAAIQLNFTLRTSTSCKTVHLAGSWDGYKNQLPLSKDPTSAKPGGWKGTFRFAGTTLQQGGRYWYYYVIDGYHVSHDPARESITEPTTGRKLNVLDIPSAKGAKPAPKAAPKSSHNRNSSTATIPKGRSLSPSQIACPRPTKPHETRRIATEHYTSNEVDELALRFQNQTFSDSEASSIISSSSDSDDGSDDGSDISSDVPSLSSRSSHNSSPSSVSSDGSACTCERYGITRSGARVKLDCGGTRCGRSETSSVCSSESEGEYRNRSTRRQGVMVRR